MPVYTVHEAETQLSKLMERAERGEEVPAEGKPHEPVAPVNKPKRQPGGFAGQIVIHDSFFDPMTEDELREFGEGHPGDPLRLPLRGRNDEASS